MRVLREADRATSCFPESHQDEGGLSNDTRMTAI